MSQSNKRYDEMLELLNDYLKKSKKLMSSHSEEPTLPTIFVISAPMSGSTLASQILLYPQIFSGISNFVARFWEAPHVGAIIEQIFSWGETEKDNVFHSVHGQTKGLLGSHEFGRFWNRWFDLGKETHKLTDQDLSKINQVALKREIGNLEYVSKKPILFKNNTWCSFQADWLSNVLPHSIFVVCERPILYVAQWLMLTRRQIYQNDETWWSMKPSNFRMIKEKSKWEQVLLQADFCQKELNDSVSKIPEDRVIKVEYKDICEHPKKLLYKVINMCIAQGVTLDLCDVEYPTFTSTDTQILNNKDWDELVKTYEQLQLK